ncbi:Short-chain dehydrogenase/reductase ABA4 [Paramyrothecium foliicola]|nr:Short-chain dehydrogenase/reductase ABA4 [Paramyrothecium foliicola]
MSFRLLDVYTGKLTEYPLSSRPLYLAASHAWSERLFPTGVDFLASPGRSALIATLAQRYPTITSCWVDTICINQNDEDDKLRQIPMMGEIFGGAEAVLIILGCVLGMRQDLVDDTTKRLSGALSMEADEAWASEGLYWQNGDGRGLIAQAMRGLARLTTTSWSTRVWTLQEYILARRVVWIGKDLESLILDDRLFSALPNICDTLNIQECLGDEFVKLYGFFSGMANCRLGPIEKTRVMELLGNRKATVECDEVYGVMAASGVEIPTIKGERKESAWARWVEAALGRGHLRWLLMPAVIEPLPFSPQPIARNCIVVPFDMRHKASSGSALDEVKPLGPIEVKNGTVTVTGRMIGTCRVGARLGKVHEPMPNRIHRDITLIQFTLGKWPRALKVASAFGAGRYNPKQTILIAQALFNNWTRALYAVRRRKEDDFKMKLRRGRQTLIWQDFMALQMGQMPGMNDGVAYLTKIRRLSVAIDALLVLAPDQEVPDEELVVVDIGGRTVDERCIFMIATKPSPEDGSSNDVLHKLCVTLPVTAMSLEGKVFAVTGGAGGIGLATAKLISERGGTVCISDVSTDALAEAEAYFKEQQRSYLAHKVNVANRDEVESWIDEIVAKFGRLDGAANVAGVIGKDHGVKSVADLDDGEWDKIMAVNLTGTMFCLRKELRVIADGGSIVNAGIANHGAYAASKHGVIGLTKAAAKENGVREVRVNAVAPGSIYTPMMQGWWDLNNRPADAEFSDPTAIRRLGTAEEAAKLITFLLGPDSTFITGAVYSIDGGWM